MSDDTRYPYTYAADLIRSIPDFGKNGIKLSRSEASRIRQLFAEVLDIPDEELADKLAGHYIRNQAKITEEGIKNILFTTWKNGIEVVPDEV